MKLHVFVLLLSFSLLPIFGQDNGMYIEISVKDSILVSPNKIVYQVSVAEAEDEFGAFDEAMEEEAYDEDDGVLKDAPYAFEEEAEKERIKRDKEVNLQLESFKKFLKKKKISWEKKTVKETFMGIEGDDKEVYEFVITSLEDLDAVKEEIKSRDGLSGETGEISYPEMSLATKRKLVEQLNKKAREEAQMMAETNGAKVGKILQIKERMMGAQDYEGLMDNIGGGFLGDIIKSLTNKLGSGASSESLQKKETRILVYRFEMIYN